MGTAQAGVAAGAGPVAPAAVMVEVTDVTRTFGRGPTAVHALCGVSFTLPAGRLTALCGRSGSGKTTLLNIVGGLDRPDTGSVQVGDHTVSAMGERERTMLRRATVAFVFQSFGLIHRPGAGRNGAAGRA
jgi:putative ABC transport system ATP-binding protein